MERHWHDALGTSMVASCACSSTASTSAGTPTGISMAHGMPTRDDFHIGDHRGTCSSPLGFVGDIDAVAIGVDLRPVDWSGM